MAIAWQSRGCRSPGRAHQVDSRPRAPRPPVRPQAFASMQSDHLAVLGAYSAFDGMRGEARFSFARDRFLGIKTLQAGGARLPDCLIACLID
eukprot:3446066-Prymnesium_polylepis.1